MQTEPSPKLTRRFSRESRSSGKVVGVVPTMGALHAGHVSLIEAARRDCDAVIVTIFVNPTQFGPNEDFDKYPRTLDDDLAKCEAAGADFVFTPSVGDMYPADAQTHVHTSEVTKMLEGATRPTHFDGVTTVVAKLFNVTEPDRAYFGQKDFQQQLVIRQMVSDLDFGLEVVTCPIVREEDGLAMSSRNRYMSADDRQRALVLSRSLFEAEEAAANGASVSDVGEALLARLSSAEGVDLDYAVVANPKTLAAAEEACDEVVALVAAKVGKTRLIDNHVLNFQ